MMHPTHPLSMNDVNFWVAFNQLVIGIALSPLGYLLQQVGDHHTKSVDNMPENFLDGFKCGVLGIGNIRGYDTDGIDVTDHKGPCEYAVIATFVYVFVVCSYNMLMLWVIKEETVVLFFIANAITMPLVALISTSELYTSLGLVKVAFSPWQVLGFVVAILGTIIYRTVPDSNMDVDDNEEDSMSPIRSNRRGDVSWPDTPKNTLGDIVGPDDNFPSLLMSDESSDGGLGFSPPRNRLLDEPFLSPSSQIGRSTQTRSF